MFYNDHAKNVSTSPPAGRMSGCQYARLLLALLLAFLPFMSWADGHFKDLNTDWKDKDIKAINRQPDFVYPHLQINLCFYESYKHHSFFTHSKTEAGVDGPALYVDGKYICSPDYELAWPGINGLGNKDGLDNERDEDGWWRDGYEKVVDGVKYYVKFYDPCKKDNRYYVTLHVFMDKWDGGKDHEIKIRGQWRSKGEDGIDRRVMEETTWIAKAFYKPNTWSASFFEKSDYNAITFKGALNTNVGPTNVGISMDGNYTSTKYLYGSKVLSKGIKDASIDVNLENVWKEYGEKDFWVQQSVDMTFDNKAYPSTTVWNSVKVTLDDFLRADSINAESDMWSKKVKLTWGVTETKNNIEGTWSIYRYMKNDPGNIELVKEKMPKKTRSTEIDVPQYDADYVFKLAFVPAGQVGNAYMEKLAKDVSCQVKREFVINKLDVIGDSTAINLTWESQAFEGNENYTFKIYRTEDEKLKSGWSEVGSVNVTDKKQTKYNFTDSNNLRSCHVYFYKVKVTMLENYTFELPDDDVRGGRLAGNSGVVSLSATKGDFNSMVRLSWEARQIGSDPTRYELKRKVKGKKDWVTIYKTNGTLASYYYEDNTALPGLYYDYKVASITLCDGQDSRLEASDDGFCRATGIVSGRISYGTGMAVDSTRVTLVRNGEGTNGQSQFYSLAVSSAGDGVFLSLDSDVLNSQFGAKAYTVQMLVRPDASQKGQQPTLFDLGGHLQLQLGQYDAEKGFPLVLVGPSMHETLAKLYLQTGVFTSLTLSVDALGKATVTCVNAVDSLESAIAAAMYKVSFTEQDSTGLCLGGSYDRLADHAFCGYIDEMRIFSGRALMKEEILRNYNHSLTGSEDGLFAYWPVDEGIDGQTTAYDYSKTGGVPNGNHGQLGPTTKPTNAVLPTEHQFGLFTNTDSQGNFVIRGVPFSGDGTTYKIVPTKDIHQFSPLFTTRYVSASALVHNNVDFEDVSSFPVSGSVYYAGTNYPVQGAQFEVDGTVCSKDGKVITTDENGKYTISVPIGDHFIQVSKNGHVFSKGGRYPDDPNGVGPRLTFDREVKDLVFFDSTLVNFTGKVVGGDIEGKKAVGFGLSKNNLGVVELVIYPTNSSGRYLNVVDSISGTVVKYVSNPDSVIVNSATDTIASQSWRGGGRPDKAQKIFIRTDAKTGEFSAMVPPLRYKVEAPKVKATGLTIDSSTSSTEIDLTNPLEEWSDTLYSSTKEVERLYTYNKKLAITYHSVPQFNVKQREIDDGAFGIKEYTTTDNLGEIIVSDIYSIENGKPVYNYNGAPLFVEMDTYVFDIEAFEKYINGDDNTTDVVPLRDLEVTVSNALSSQQQVYSINNPQGGTPGSVVNMVDNVLVLDSLGRATYIWKAGLPNITAPYKRTISMSYDVNGRNYMWNPYGDGTNRLEGIILGTLPTGNNFITEGPTMLQMILRDPPGTGSSAQWTTGSVKSKYSYQGKTFSTDNNVQVVTHLGMKTALSKGLGVAFISEMESKYDVEAGMNFVYQSESGNSWTSTVSVERAISTSAEPNYVGADGDLFIGSSTNLLYGRARNLTFLREDDGVRLGVDDAYTTGLDFKTDFAYSAYYIENDLIPELIRQRNALLTYVGDINDYVPNSDDAVVYLTTLKPEDKGYGTNNNDKVWGKDAVFSSVGKSYTMIIGNLPNTSNDTLAGFNDKIIWYNEQISRWEHWLCTNEEEKVKAFNENDKVKDVKNYSFDAGASITHTATNEKGTGKQYDHNFQAIAHVGGATGVRISGIGLSINLSTDTGGGTHDTGESTETESASFSYTFAETDGDAISVDVYDYGKYSPIFRTRGGQTSAPYEGEVKTKYYMPGTTIMEATMQIEVPKIDVDVATVTDVPAGQPANYTLRLKNESQTGVDVCYELKMMEGTNPNGAKLTIDGQPLTSGRIILVPAGETITKALQLTQTNQGVLDYKNLGIVLLSQSEEEIADTVYVTAHFAPSSSAVDMSLSRTTINTSVGENLTISFDKFDRNYFNLKAFRIQYQKQGDTDWTLLHEYFINRKDSTANSEPLPDGATVNYKLNMHDYSDGKYVFRVVSVCHYGLGEVYNTSKEIMLVKDMQKPCVLGQPTPTNGVLTAADDISLTFSENILKGELDKNMNFLVTGVLNGAKVDHATAFNLSDMAEAASTEASINLSDKSFAFDLWINAKASGTILCHGSEPTRFVATISDAGKLIVTVGTDTYQSVNSVEMNKWGYLHMDYKRLESGGLLNAAMVQDDGMVSLFVDTPVTQYDGNGPLSVGHNLNAAIHELCLWDEARTIEVSLAERSKTKQPSTRHLIGYWKMNEGEGTSLRDYSRSRHMTAATESWYVNNENKAVELSGTDHLAIRMVECSPLETDDYAVELWMRADKQRGEAQIIQSGKMSLWLDNAGLMYIESGNSPIKVSNAPLTDNVWHHVALNVLRDGNAAVYVDGVRTYAVSARKMSGIATDSLYVGARRGLVDESMGRHDFDRHFTGQIDELRVWKATMNAELLRTNRKVRLTGNEPGLVAYYPFEEKTLDDYHQMVTNGSPKDLVSGKLVAVCGKTIVYTDEAPALRTKPTEQNVDFTFTASDNKIVINLNEDEAAIDGCTLNFTVCNVRDENGNYSEPVRWSAFVNHRQLSWSENNVVLTKKVGEPLTFSVNVVNNGGKQQMWEINGLPSWLSVNTDNGTTDPLEQDEVTFTVAKFTPIGTYSQTVYLTGGDAIEVPLTINLSVTGDEPDWTVDRNNYEFTMNMIALLSVLDVPSSDPGDKLAVFVGDECRGVGHPVYSRRYDCYYVLLDVYGNESDDGRPLSFRVYDASTGVSYSQVLSIPDSVLFANNQVIGSYAVPIALNALNRLEQSVDMARGWNWMALYVQPDDWSMPTVLAPLTDYITRAKNQTGFMEPTSSGWNGEVIRMNNREMYKLQLSSPAVLKVTGAVADTSACNLTVVREWNWIAYNGTSAMSLEEAFAGLQPVDGDVVKAQSGFAVYDGYEWAGTLSLLTPGQGYMLYSASSSERTFSYPKASQAGKHAKAMVQHQVVAGYFVPVDYHKYPDNMSLIARVMFADEALAGVEIGVFSGEECRAHAYTNDAGLAYISIPGNERTALSFKLWKDGKVYSSSTVLDYVSDGITGSTRNPFVIDFDTSTGIGVVDRGGDNAEWFTPGGQKLDSMPKAAGVYVVKRYDTKACRVVAEKVIITNQGIR